MPLATFSITPEGREVVDGYAVYRNRVLFRFGDYPDHGISVTPADGVAAIGAFAGPLGGNIEHTAFLKGQANFVDAIRVDESDPAHLRGDVRIPLWLDEGLGVAEKKVSAEWCKATKAFKGVALTVNPTFPEADLMACFAKHSSRHGKHAMQSIHDTAAASGAYCMDPPGDTGNVASFIMRHERTTLQKIHDHAVESGAACHGSSAYFSRNPAKGKKMGLYHKLLAIFASAPRDVELTDDEVTAIFSKEGTKPTPEVKPEAKPAPEVKPTPETADFSKNPEFVRLQRQNADQQRRLLLVDATAWADAEVAARRALPAEKPSMIAAFAQATADDAADDGLARFSAEAKAVGASRVEVLKAVFAARPAHTLFAEHLATLDPEGLKQAELLLLPQTASFKAKDKVDPDEIAALRKHSPLLSQNTAA